MSYAQKAPEELKKKFAHLVWVYGSALCLLFASVLCTVIVSEISISRLDTAPREINISGRQRMLSQRMLKEALLVSADNSYLEKTQKTQQLFDSSLQQLIKGDREAGIEAPFNSEIKDQLIS